MDLMKVNINDTLFINDSVDIMESITNDNGPDGYKYSVEKDEIHLKDINTSNNVNLLKLTRSDGKYFLLNISEKFKDTFVTLYREISEYDYQCRSHLLEQHLYCLFDEPEDRNNFQPCDLNYSKSFTLYCFNRENRDIVDKEYPASHYTTEYFRNKKDDIFTAIHTYNIANNEPDAYLMILEEGGIDKETGNKDPDGGFVRLFVGRDVEINYIKTFCD